VITDYEQYVGQKTLKMDPKYRVSIQGSWRSEPSERIYLQHGENAGVPFLKVLSRSAYLDRVKRVEESQMTAAEKSYLLKMLASSCRDAQINDQGKLLVPKEVSEKAGISADSDVVLNGCGIYFEIWSKENYEKIHAVNTAKLAEIDTLGIFD
jgi:DNA-binding transcriptional regulator/RsmH inhibitor MraZ